MNKQAHTFKSNIEPEQICKGCDYFETNPYANLKNCVGYCNNSNPMVLYNYPEICTDRKPIMEGF